ncbi:DNA adenine methylase [Glycomyces buryatensis]|uniref:DNA adenine methylase n=1 Tax=Glycomyces buryatensis TaxID=2570927 RepID=A0A4S8Q861_9ACTN|nr:DNA adenine methylase [Glycomyces buryatensis]THV40563.1 DNA adenine methylase [Glycomyces buryatensis]
MPPNDTAVKPPVPYYGGKQRLAEPIVELLSRVPHQHYVEPYAGSLAVLLTKPKARMETVNDLDGDLMTFWRIVRDRPDDFERAVALTPHSRAEYAAACAPAGVDACEVEVARRVWVRLTQSRTGTQRAVGWRHHQDPNGSSIGMPAYLDAYRSRMPAAAARLRGVSLEARPALEVIAAYGRHSGVLLYVDPPYLGSTRARNYRHEMRTETDHQALAEALHTCRAAVVLSGYDSELYRELYPGWHRVAIASGTSQGGTWHERTEVIWSNRDLTAQPTLFDLQPKDAGR